jgi:hypothetical protein
MRLRRLPRLPLRVQRRRNNRAARIRPITAIGLMSLLVGCASSSQIVTGMPRTAIAASAVRVYTQAPANFEEIAQFSASRRSVSAADGERAIQKMIVTMRAEAAQLGANGLLLEDFTDANSLALGTGAGTQTYTHNGSISLGVDGSLGVVKKTAKARAIFVPP